MLLQVIILDLKVFLHHVSIIHPKSWKCHQWYKHIFGDGKCVQFDLTEDGKNCGFKYEKDMSVRSYEENEFTRTITFPNNIERIPDINIENNRNWTFINS